ncbi:hypothetical protein AQJ84_03030 [Streptomyces resistomycificus]|uniref:SGNH hydrolase-type esterase domain-containing protein n=2 Tax=Streptomyces resistomycificus TaxID=67356 RepID=A0A0L8LXZ8_9ACTN|nr:hypothetical protein ADK37_03050 [Streptomyces resistomycificus]KUO01434.1 hypothetical protein AQJ84_03030 [Streptomyces resistomycificus]
MNIAIMTRGVPDQVRVVDNPISAGRRALGVRFGQHWYFTFHGLSGGGGDSARMLDAIDDAVGLWASQDGTSYEWAVGGDFNASPEDLQGRPHFPVAQVYRTRQATQAGSGELDYVVADQWVDRLPSRLARGGSDHWAVQVGPDQPVSDPSAPVPTRVEVLGDSISHGINSSHGNGYRAGLYDDLKYNFIVDDTGMVMKRDVDMVGSRRSGGMADADHEGHPGFRIDEIADVADCSIKEHRPNLVTLMAGTNDMNQNYQLDRAPERLGALIDQILRDAPEATVLVATLIPSTKAGMQAKIDRYNAELPRIVDERREQGKHVRLVSMGELTTEDVDGSHPDDEGYLKVARAFHAAALLVESQGWLKEPVPVTEGACDPTGPDTGEGEGGSAAGEGWHSLGVIAPGMQSPRGRTDLADFDGDGREDYVRVPDTGRLRIGLNTRAEPGKPHWADVDTDFSVQDSDQAESLRFADLTGDGRSDIVEVRPTGSSTEILIHYVNEGVRDGRITWSGAVVATNPKAAGVRRESVRFADVNGDRRDDYLRVGDDGAVHAYLNLPAQNSGYRFEEILNWAPGVSYGSRDKLRLADVNGDGKDDYLMVGSTGAVHAYINDGGRGAGGFTEHRNFVKETGYPGEKSAFRDISGDGKADYVVVYNGGAVRCWLNRGGNI